MAWVNNVESEEHRKAVAALEALKSKEQEFAASRGRIVEKTEFGTRIKYVKQKNKKL